MEEELWGPINNNAWQTTPYIAGKLTTEGDVKQGKAVYFIQEPDDETRCEPMKLPSCAIVPDDETNEEIPAIAIQAEHLMTCIRSTIP